MNAKFGWILRKIAFKLAVNDTLHVLIVSKSSLRLCAFALKFTEMLIEVTGNILGIYSPFQSLLTQN